MSEDWYYVRDGKQVGPINAVELKRLVQIGELTPADMVSRKGLGKWVPAASIRGLFEATADSQEKVLFTQGDVTLTTSTLVIGPNQFDVRNVQAVNVSPVIEGSPHGAAAAFCMACYSFCAGAIFGPALFLGGLFVVVNALLVRADAGLDEFHQRFAQMERSDNLRMGFFLLLCSLAATSASYAIGRLLLRPARNLWTPKNGEYRLIVRALGGDSACLASNDQSSLEGIAAQINDALGRPVSSVLRPAEPRWIHFIRTRVPFVFRD